MPRQIDGEPGNARQGRSAKPLGVSHDPTKALLALDLGTTLGWALALPDGTRTSGVQGFQPRRFEGGGMRYVRFRGWLSEIHQNTRPMIGTIRFEEVMRHAGTTAAHVYGGFLSHLQAWCDVESVPYAGVPVGAIKKFATGKGNAKKDAMIEAARRRGFDPADDNEADAIAIMLGTLAGEL